MPLIVTDNAGDRMTARSTSATSGLLALDEALAGAVADLMLDEAGFDPIAESRPVWRLRAVHDHAGRRRRG